MKYKKVTLEEVETAIEKLGGKKVWDAWLKGEKTITVEDTIPKFFEKKAWRIPTGLKFNIRSANKDFWLQQPKLNNEVDFAERLHYLHYSLNIHTAVTSKQLQKETERLLIILNNNPQVKNITNAVYLPVVLPQLITGDIGDQLALYLDGVNRSYSASFSNRSFKNYCKNSLSGQVKSVDKTRHDQLIKRMKKGPVIGIYFPNSLQGYSILADQEQMSALPEGFTLSGIDTAIAMIMYPEILARNWNTPGLDLAALQWHSKGHSLVFRASDSELTFKATDNLDEASESYSGGLLFLG